MSTIVLVEDDTSLTELLKIMLAFALPASTIRTATTGQAFVALAHTYRPDLILLDVRLPDTSGVALYRLIRRLHDLSQVPVLFVTATPHLVSEAALQGPYSCLGKPFDLKTFIACVRGLVGRVPIGAASA
jgi:DNA-binding response OmpR family regulator